MKKFLAMLIFIMLWPAAIWAETYESTLGFSMDIPEHWLIMSKQELRDNPDIFNFDSELFKNVDKNVFEQTKKLISSGKIEVYFNQKTSDARFADNINVTKRVGRLPQTDAEYKKVCEQLPAALSKILGKAVAIYQCSVKNIGSMNAFYLENDGLIDGTRSLQYHIQKSPSVMLIFTATCNNDNLEAIKYEFNEMISSVVLE
ncbi:hypothetical protein ACFL2O_06750 [Thermodesulfobacteriota bacterium]